MLTRIPSSLVDQTLLVSGHTVCNCMSLSSMGFNSKAFQMQKCVFKIYSNKIIQIKRKNNNSLPQFNDRALIYHNVQS